MTKLKIEIPEKYSDRDSDLIKDLKNIIAIINRCKPESIKILPQKPEIEIEFE